MQQLRKKVRNGDWDDRNSKWRHHELYKNVFALARRGMHEKLHFIKADNIG
jgi:hypothetical protein